MIHKTKTKPKGTTFENIGVCPHCGEVDGYYNYGPNHWFICSKHKVKWLAAYDLFSTWRNETTGDWINNRLNFEDYEPIVPASNTKSRRSRVYNYIGLTHNVEWL